tara:strand:- start:102 stop:788 length:687 start_codon:yes stop_codon:yes gene_type:complete
MNLEKRIREAVAETLGVKKLKEAYVTQAKKFKLPTEFLSDKVKTARQKDFEAYVDALNETSARLDTASREDANNSASEFRQLKVDEVYCLNASFMRAFHFENISDLQSELSMDSLSFMRLERDFGSFDDWQKDFIACGMSSRDGYALTAYNAFLGRYMNVCVDGESENVPVGCFPIICLDVSEGAYFKDYLDDRKTYIVAMMKELNWEKIEERIKKSEKIAKIYGAAK